MKQRAYIGFVWKEPCPQGSCSCCSDSHSLVTSTTHGWFSMKTTWGVRNLCPNEYHLFILFPWKLLYRRNGWWTRGWWCCCHTILYENCSLHVRLIQSILVHQSFILHSGHFNGDLGQNILTAVFQLGLSVASPPPDLPAFQILGGTPEKYHIAWFGIMPRWSPHIPLVQTEPTFFFEDIPS